MISIHALREEGDATVFNAAEREKHFYPRPPRGGRLRLYLWERNAAYFYPRPPRGGRRAGCKLLVCWCHISIHALREEGDALWTQRLAPRCYFYPRPPRGGRRPLPLPTDLVRSISIHALREEGDHGRRVRRHRYGNFYPRPPRGGRLAQRRLLGQ